MTSLRTEILLIQNDGIKQSLEHHNILSMTISPPIPKFATEHAFICLAISLHQVVSTSGLVDPLDFL